MNWPQAVLNQEGLEEEHTMFNFTPPLRGGEAEKGVAKPLEHKGTYKKTWIYKN